MNSSHTATMDLDAHVAQFKEDGCTVFPGIFEESQMQVWRDLFAELQQGEKDPTKPSYWFGGIFEKAPELLLPAVNHSLLLDFAEKIMGPFVQLDNLSLVGFPSMDASQSQGKVSGWHRDRWAKLPSGAYERPLAINGISYFQDLTVAAGPLRVVPGSHRDPVIMEEAMRNLPHPQERVLELKAGDVVFIHNALLHSGTPNTSGKTRYFFSLYYNLTWLKHTDNHSGPHTQELLKVARDLEDRRLLRLFGEDDHMAQRANSGFVGPDEPSWEKWLAEDRAAYKGSVARNSASG